MKNKDLKLCFVESLGWDIAALYYSNKDAKDVWGDDWNDRPYEHNAGEPYMNDGDTFEKIIIDVGSQMQLPEDGYLNSPYSVEDINSGAIAWIRIIEGKHSYSLAANSTIEDLYRLAKSGDVDISIYRKDVESECNVDSMLENKHELKIDKPRGYCLK